MAEIRMALPPLYPFNDDEVAANPGGFRQFLAQSAIGADERAKARAMNNKKRKGRRK